ncbi:MAG: YceI family protein [Woeseiaceae bacterium]|nr:YceI family protein [Woeseiaceae bacterium]
MRILSRLLALIAVLAPLASLAQEAVPQREYRVDSDSSLLRVLAYPDGPLRRFGHHHVISHRGLSGSVSVPANPLESTIHLQLSVADFEVDDPDLRALEGEDFEKEVPQKDKDGTRANMLGERQLHAEQFPSIQIRSTAIEGSLPEVNIVATVTVKGVENTVTFPASIELTDDAFVARGEREILHSELGLEYFTAAGGALAVRDLLVFKYEISGLRVADSEP